MSNAPSKTPYELLGIDVAATVAALMQDPNLSQSHVLQRAGAKALHQIGELPADMLSLLAQPVKST